MMVAFPRNHAFVRFTTTDFVERFQKTWPQTTLHVREGVASLLQEWLLEKRVDVAVLHNPPHLESLNIRPLLTERMMVIGPPVRRPRPCRSAKLMLFANLIGGLERLRSRRSRA